MLPKPPSSGWISRNWDRIETFLRLAGQMMTALQHFSGYSMSLLDRTNVIHHSSSQLCVDNILLNCLIAGGTSSRQACYFSAVHRECMQENSCTCEAMESWDLVASETQQMHKMTMDYTVLDKTITYMKDTSDLCLISWHIFLHGEKGEKTVSKCQFSWSYKCEKKTSVRGDKIDHPIHTESEQPWSHLLKKFEAPYRELSLWWSKHLKLHRGWRQNPLEHGRAIDSTTWRTFHSGCKRPSLCCSGQKCRGFWETARIDVIVWEHVSLLVVNGCSQFVLCVVLLTHVTQCLFDIWNNFPLCDGSDSVSRSVRIFANFSVMSRPPKQRMARGRAKPS